MLYSMNIERENIMNRIRVTTYRAAFGRAINLSDAQVKSIEGRTLRTETGDAYRPDRQSHMGIPMAWESLRAMPGVSVPKGVILVKSAHGAQIKAWRTGNASCTLECVASGRRRDVDFGDLRLSSVGLRGLGRDIPPGPPVRGPVTGRMIVDGQWTSDELVGESLSRLRTHFGLSRVPW